MPRWRNRLSQRLPRPVLIWAVLTVLMALGVLSSIFDLAGVPARETMRANTEQQRVIIDPKTGDVSGLSAPADTAAAFDVAPEEEPAPEEPIAQEPEEEAPVAVEPTQSKPSSAKPTESSFTPLVLSRMEAPTPLVPRSNESLVSAPAPEVSEKVGDELLPRRGEKNASPSSLYAKAFIRQPDQHLVAIVVTDIGFHGELLQQAIDLPNAVTIGVSPYAEAAADQIGALRNKGHEVWGMLPAMGRRYPQDDPGPLGLINALTIKGAMARLHTIMATTIGSVGLILPPDETISAARDLWKPIMDEIDARGLYVLSTHATRTPKDLSSDANQQKHIRRADIIIDTLATDAVIRSKLAGITEATAEQPELIVLMSARPQALRLLDEWLKADPLAGKAKLAPLSAIYMPYQEPAKAPEGDGKEKADSGGH
jgi:polysaccharide deacetylase 2 family uncharacterized protein YibQ